MRVETVTVRDVTTWPLLPRASRIFCCSSPRSDMPKRFSNVPEHLREPHHVAWSDLPPFYWKALGITIALGFITGLIWIAWRLFDLHVLN